MAFCPNCGAQATGSFCPNCGTALGAGATGFSPTAAGGQGISENVAGALCYVPFLIGLICSLVLLLIAPYNRNRFVRFHAFQSLFLHLALFILSIVLSVLIGLLTVATHGAGILFAGLHPLLWLASFVLSLVLMYQAYNRQRTHLPVIGDLAEKQA